MKKNAQSMRVIIAGGRSFSDYELLKSKVLYFTRNMNDFTVVSGAAGGADSLGEVFAIEHKLSLISAPANWTRYGKSAGYIRNREMMEISDFLIAFWDGESKGTKLMIDLFKDNNKPYRVVRY